MSSTPVAIAISVAFSAVLLSGCATRVAMYNGPKRSESQLALIPSDQAHPDVRVTRVDGRAVGIGRPTIELLPGAHTLEVVYTPPNVVSSYPVQIRFRAEAAHTYRLSARMLYGKVDEQGVWGGKYRAYLQDAKGGREVGRSAAPGPIAEPERAPVRKNPRR